MPSPVIIDIITTEIEKEETTLEIPSNCPTCNSPLERVKDQLFCRNTSCPAQNAKMVEGFCKKMKIKGFGPKTIEKLELSSLSQLYSLTIEDMTDHLGEKTAVKLRAEIDSKRSLPFSDFIGALGIPLIGTVAGNKLGSNINSWDEVTSKACKEAGLGEKATDSLLNWLATDTGVDVLNLSIEFTENTNPQPTAGTASTEALGDVVITGKLNDFKNRAEAALFLQNQGYTVKTGVTKKTIALICEDGSTGSKVAKAQTYGVPILTIKTLISEK